MGGAKYYIISIYFKYILINIIIFIGLIWISQVLRILELQYSISNQIIDVVKTTFLVLPSFMNPLMPFLLILGSFFTNYKLNANNEIIILKQYLDPKGLSKIILIITIILGIIIFVNSELISVNSYHKYKIEELKIRNNLKLGVPSKNEFHIENELSIFFEKEKGSVFYNIEALIYKDGQFIKSRTAKTEISKKNFNIIFNYGERILLNENEKSITNFDKFTYSIENKNIEPLLMDKEHYNTLELIKHDNKDYIYHGHNKIYQYVLTLLIILASFKIIFLFEPKKNLLMKFIIIFFSLLLIQILNSYSIYLLNSDYLNILTYYLFNYSSLILFSIIFIKIIK